MNLPRIHIEGPRPITPRQGAAMAPFWDGLSQGRLVSTQCTSCSHTAFPPRELCPKCHAVNPRWVELPEEGTIYSFTTIHMGAGDFGKEGPYDVAIIDLVDGPRLVTRLLQNEIAPQINGRVALVVLVYSDGCLFAARPQAAGPPPV